MRADQKAGILALAAKAKKGELTAKDVPLAGTIIEQLVEAVERAEVATLDVFAGDAVMGLAPLSEEEMLSPRQIAVAAFDIADACMAERERRREAAETRDHKKSEASDGHE